VLQSLGLPATVCESVSAALAWMDVVPEVSPVAGEFALVLDLLESYLFLLMITS
jgi:hypothetical protein